MFHRGIDIEVVRFFRVGDEHRIRHGFGKHPESPLGLFKRVARLDVFGDILGHAEQVAGLSSVVEQGHLADPPDAACPQGVADSVGRNVDRVPACQDFAVRGHRCLRTFGREQVAIGMTDEVPAGKTGHPLGGLVDTQIGQVARVLDKQHHRRMVDHRPEERFRGLERLLVLLAAGDVKLNGNEFLDIAVGIVNRLHLDLDPEFPAVFRIIEKLGLETAAVSEIPADRGDRGAIGGRALQEFAGLATQRFGQRVSGDAREAAVDPFDAATSVSDDHGIVRAVRDHREIPGVALAFRQFGVFLL